MYSPYRVRVGIPLVHDARALHEETLLQLELCQERNPENRPLRRLLEDIRNLELTGAR